ncbi:3-methyladenine DNA glycosylase AlkC [Lysinibacillus parviboronicapiens]|uniref:3-methyladenine DNA glycosylase AlkC n=1 Tax=Lysinibacillus parviboronicapiens TaxID=436516 RepID=A0ABV2PR47_9BACI
MIHEHVLNRKGARKSSDIPNEILDLLNRGLIESVNLIEWQAVNHQILLKHVIPSFNLEKGKMDVLLTEMANQNAFTGMKAIRTTSDLLTTVMVEENEAKRLEILTYCANHISDSVRCWAAFMNKNRQQTLEEKLSFIRHFAADHHFGVREIAWMAIREDLSEDIDKSVELLTVWAKDDNENIRRFAVESMRPRGVWTKHIEILKQEPHKALPLLALLKADPSKYVQDSVGNWLNDASKTQANWVLTICEKWHKESEANATDKIIKKATRTIMKNNC